MQLTGLARARGLEETVEIAAASPFCRGLETGEVRKIVQAARKVGAAAGEFHFLQGERSRYVFLLLRGRVKLAQTTPEGDQVTARLVGPGEIFGWVPLWGVRTYPTSAEALEASEALRWDETALGRLLLELPMLALNTLHLIGEELHELRVRFLELATARVEQRLARTLLRLAARAGRPVPTGTLIDFPLTRQELAEMTGTTLHTVSRILSRWKQAGIVAAGRRRIVIRRPEALAAVGDAGTSA